MKMVSRGIRPIRSSGKNRKSSPTQNCPVFQLLQSAGAHNACLLNAFRVSGRFCSYMRSTISMRLTRSKARTDSPVNIVHRSAHPRDSTPPRRRRLLHSGLQPSCSSSTNVRVHQRNTRIASRGRCWITTQHNVIVPSEPNTM